jgi:hypothetical protein
MACRQNVRSIKRRHRQCSVAPPLLVDVMLQSFALVYQRYFGVYGVVVLMMFVIMFIHQKRLVLPTHFWDLNLFVVKQPIYATTK